MQPALKITPNSWLDQNVMRSLESCVPADCKEPIETAFRIAAIANELVIHQADMCSGGDFGDHPEKKRLDSLLVAMESAFELAWSRAGRRVANGNWPQNHWPPKDGERT